LWAGKIYPKENVSTCKMGIIIWFAFQNFMMETRFQEHVHSLIWRYAVVSFLCLLRVNCLTWNNFVGKLNRHKQIYLTVIREDSKVL
jgi:hypothetical protein